MIYAFLVGMVGAIGGAMGAVLYMEYHDRRRDALRNRLVDSGIGKDNAYMLGDGYGVELCGYGTFCLTHASIPFTAIPTVSNHYMVSVTI